MNRSFALVLLVLWLAAACACSPGAAQSPPGVLQPEARSAGSRGGQTSTALEGQIRVLTSSQAVSRAHWGVMVTGLDGTAIAALHEGQLFQPASNAKLYTTAAAMALLGPDQRFTTRVEYETTGERKETVNGDVTLVGGGDGDLSDLDFPYRGLADKVGALGRAPLYDLAQLADQIAAAGIARIQGDIVGDDTVFPYEPYPQDWAVDDMVWGYGAPVSGLTVGDNQMRLVVRPGKSTAERPAVDVAPGIPGYFEIDASGLATSPAKSGSHVEMERAAGSKRIRIYGSVAVDSPPDAEEVAIADPAEYAAMVLKQMLEARGVRVDGAARAKHRYVTGGVGFLAEARQPLPGLPKASAVSTLLTGKVSCIDACPVILQHTSPSVAEDILLTNKTSQNLHAELLLHHLGKTYGAPSAGGVDGSTAEGVRVVRQFLINAGIDAKDFVFYDGSGLSGHDLVTPRATAKLLAYAAHDPVTGLPQPWFAPWRASLPVGGVDGSLEGRFKDAPLKGHVYAKTGTLGEARALSGYVDCASGRTVIFSIMVNGYVPGTAEIRPTMDQIVATIAAAL